MKKLIFSAAMLSSAWAAAQNTGIGTTSPTEKLEVIGNAKVRGTGYFTNGDKFNVSITPLFNDYSVIQAYEGPGVFNNLQIDSKKLILNNKNGGYTTIGGKTQIGYDSSIVPTEVLNVNGNIKAESLVGIGDRIVLANENGVLKTQSTADAVAANSEWIYDATSNRINLKRSAQQTGFTNKVFYDNTNGAYFNVSQESTRWFDRATNTYLTGLSTLKGAYNHTFVTSDKITPGDGDGAKIVTKSSLLVNETSGNEIKFAIGSQSGVTLDEASTSPVDVVYGAQNSIAKNNTGTNRRIMGGNNSVMINNGNVSQFAIGQASSISVHTPQNVTGAVIGGYSGINLTSRSGLVNNMSGFSSEFIFEGANKVLDAKGISVTFQDDGNPSAPAIDNLYGYTLSRRLDVTNVKNFYGLYFNDVNGASQNNYSIYTNAGKVRFGDLPASTAATDKIVVADADGVLKTQSTADAVAANSEWVYDAATNRINLKRSGRETEFENKVYYSNTTGGLMNSDSDEILQTRSRLEAGVVSIEDTTTPLADFEGVRDFTYAKAENIKPIISIGSTGTTDVTKMLTREILRSSPSDSQTKHLFIDSKSLYIPTDDANNYTSVYASNAGVSLGGTGTVANAIGVHGSATSYNSQKVAGYTTGVLGSNSVVTTGTLGQVYGVFGRNFYYSPNGGTVTKSAAGLFSSSMPYGQTGDNTLISNYYGIEVVSNNNSRNSGAGNHMIGTVTTTGQSGLTKYLKVSGITNTAATGSSAQAPDLLYGLENRVIHSSTTSAPTSIFGIYNNSNLGTGALAPANHYGLYLENVAGATNNNYSIYTNAGKLRFGDLTGTGDRLVIADANGVLKTSDATAISSAAEPWRVIGTNDPATSNTQNIYQMGDVTVGRTSDDAELFNPYQWPNSTSTGNKFKSYRTFTANDNSFDGKSIGLLDGSALSLISRSKDDGRFVGGQSTIYLSAGSLTDSSTSIEANTASIRKYGNDANTAEEKKNHLFINNRLNNGVTIAFTNANELDFRIGGYFVDKENSKMIITPNGNIGIATITPTEKLEVAGNIKVTGTGAAITDGGTCTNPGTISYSVDSFYGCTPTGWKKLHN